MKHYDLLDLSQLQCLFSTLHKIYEEVHLLFISARQAAAVKRSFVLKCASSCAYARGLSVVAISANYVLPGHRPSSTYYVPLKTRVTKTCLCIPFCACVTYYALVLYIACLCLW